MNDFHLISFKNCGYEWKYEILPSELEKILTKAIQKKNKKKPINKKLQKLTPSEFILKSLKLPLMGCAAIDRIINAWKCQISCMPFPIYSDDDILNATESMAFNKKCCIGCSESFIRCCTIFVRNVKI
eukprot:421360_1